MQILAEAEDLPKTANIKAQLLSLWTAPVFGVILLIAFVAFPGFFPPMSPDMTADQVAAFYRDNTAMIRFSMITFNLCGIMLLPMFMVIVVQMKRMATQSHVFAYCYLTAAVSPRSGPTAIPSSCSCSMTWRGSFSSRRWARLSP
jgi:hypothetical protein